VWWQATSRAAELLLAAALTAAAASSFYRVFGLAPLAPVIVTGAVGPAVLAGLWSAALWSAGLWSAGPWSAGPWSAGPQPGSRRRLPLWAALAASLACWVLLAGATLLRQTEIAGIVPTAATLHGIQAGLSDSWWQLLTTILPAPASPRLLLAVQALTWLGGMAAAETVARTRRALLACAPAVAILLAGLAFGVDGPGSDTVPAAAVAAAAGLLVVLRQATDEDRQSGRFGPAGWPALAVRGVAVPAVAVVAVLAALAGPALPLATARPPFDPRRYVHPTPDIQTMTSPLDDVSLWLSEPRRPLFAVQASQPANWQLAVLDSFNGQTWSSSGGFLDTGGRVPAAETAEAAAAGAAGAGAGAAGPGETGTAAAGSGGQGLSQSVTIQHLGGAWLPAASRPALITGVPADVDPATGVLLDRAPLTPGVRYRLISAPPGLSPALLRTAEPSDDATARADLALPGQLPRVITRTARAATAGAGSPFQQAVMLADYLLGAERYEPSAPPGHSSGAIAYFLAVSHQGTSEQFATAYALMARALGLPSRVVVGFRPGREVRGGTWQVDGADALVWPEVDFARIGWTGFYPTPATAGRHSSHSVPAGQTAAEHRIVQRIGAAGSTPVATPRRPRRHHGRARGGTAAVGWPVLLAGVALALLAAYLIAVLVIPWHRRRSRQRRHEPGARVIGAWQEALDCLRACGVPASSAHSVPEIAELAARRIGAPARPALTGLASLTDHAVFAFTPVAEDAARQAWQHLGTVRHAAALRMTRRARLRARLRPAVLRAPPASASRRGR
jgi:transglutaminase-like putative cysteine protease